jgi:hypothetical protein
VLVLPQFLTFEIFSLGIVPIASAIPNNRPSLVSRFVFRGGLNLDLAVTPFLETYAIVHSRDFRLIIWEGAGLIQLPFLVVLCLGFFNEIDDIFGNRISYVGHHNEWNVEAVVACCVALPDDAFCNHVCYFFF